MSKFDYEHKPCIIFHSQSEIDDMCFILSVFTNQYTEVHRKTATYKLAERYLKFLWEYHSNA